MRFVTVATRSLNKVRPKSALVNPVRSGLSRCSHYLSDSIDMLHALFTVYLLRGPGAITLEARRRCSASQHAK